jgi:Gpi18-like mannosyltransferase
MTKKYLLLILSFFLIWRSMLFILGGKADTFLKYDPSFPYSDDILLRYHVPRWVFSWANFDGVHYITIAEHGYIGTGLIQAFFPLLPYLILHTLRLGFGDHFNTLLVGVAFTNLFAMLLAVIWFLFVKERFSVKKAWISLLVLFLFPTAFFLGALYTESLFLLLVIGSFYFAEKKWWWLASILVALASATRIVGIFLIPALFAEAFQQWLVEKKVVRLGKRRVHLKKIIFLSGKFFREEKNILLMLSLSSLGLLGYMWFLHSEFHDPLYFAHVQQAFGGGRQESLVLYPQVVWRSIRILLTSRPFDLRYAVYIEEFIAGVVAFLALLWTPNIKGVRWSYYIFALASFFLPTLTGTFSSMPRYILVCFPLYFLLTDLIQKSKTRMILWLSLSTFLLIFNTILFIQGYWVS